MPLMRLFIKDDEPVGNRNLDDILASIPDIDGDTEGYDGYENTGAAISYFDGATTVEEVYAKWGMSENKIYEVIPYIDSLPKTLDSVTKKTTLLSLLQNAAKLRLEDLIDNADSCIDVLQSEREAVVLASSASIQEMEKIIELKREEIEELRVDIINKRTKCESQLAIFDEESNKLKIIKGHIT